MNIIKKHNPYGNKTNRPDTLIIHSMSEYLRYEGRLLHASDFLENIGLSAHYLICPNGDIIKCRKTSEGAFHAKNHNYNSVGIEILVSGEHDYKGFLERIEEPYHTPEQMEALIEISKDIIKFWKIEPFNIVRHSDIDPDRKKDPGSGFPFVEYLNRL